MQLERNRPIVLLTLTLGANLQWMKIQIWMKRIYRDIGIVQNADRFSNGSMTTLVASSAFPIATPKMNKTHTPNSGGLFHMESIHGDNATFEQITAVTKYIRVYSDNPIHNQIARIIDACSYVDEGGDNLYFHLSELKDASEDLLILCCQKLRAESDKIHKEHNEQKIN